VLLVCLVAILAKLLWRPLPRGFPGDAFPHAYQLIWLVLIVQNVIAQLITGPHSSWPETAFSIYYLLLFFISAVIIYHFHYMKTRGATLEAEQLQEQETSAISA
jgi:protein-S-isoprenylcysteine O-methyltransferase Ste14